MDIRNEAEMIWKAVRYPRIKEPEFLQVLINTQSNQDAIKIIEVVVVGIWNLAVQAASDKAYDVHYEATLDCGCGGSISEAIERDLKVEVSSAHR